MMRYRTWLLAGVLLPAWALVAADKPTGQAAPATPAAAAPETAPKPDADGFYPLFDGKSLDGWKANESPDTWKVEGGNIVINGPKSHLFYTGPVNNGQFKNFHFKAEVMTFPNANSGIYFHTQFQPDGWPAKGFECQVNNTYVKDPRKTASLYAVKDVKEQIAEDGKWFLYEILVKDRKIEIKINGKTANEYEVPADYKPPAKMEGRVLGAGTFALQGHDPGSKVMYRNIAVKPLD